MSASSLRGTRGYWAGPLLHRGAAATMGNVYEPYLQLTPQVDLFYERLAQGGTFLEAAYCSQPALSWQTTFVGDPLYRPFRTSLDDQVRVLETEQHPDREWAYLRQVNLLALQGDVAGARALCAAQAERLASAVLYERLGQLAGSTDALRRALALGEQQEKPGLVRRVQAALAVLDTELPRGE